MTFRYDVVFARKVRDLHNLIITGGADIYAVADHRFLLDRMCTETTNDGRRMRGLSSDALALYGVGGEPPPPSRYPGDQADLAACELTYEVAPPHIQARILPVLQEFRAAVAPAP